MQACSECGNQLREGALFCGECGTKVKVKKASGKKKGNQSKMQSQLEKDDEFYNDIPVDQLSVDEQTNESKVIEFMAVAYCLLKWWKGEGNRDSIDISDDSMLSSLKFYSDIPFGDKTTSALCIFEANEDPMYLTLFIYPEFPSEILIDQDNFDEIIDFVTYSNSSIPYGSIELMKNGGSRTLRMKQGICLNGVKNGKVSMISNLFKDSSYYLGCALSCYPH